MSRRPLPYVRDGVCIARAFLSDADFERVYDDCRRLHRKMKREKNSVATGRMGCFIDRRSATHAVFMSDAVRAKVARLVGQPMEPSVHPIELRSYGVGAEMTWHRDDQLFSVPQCELVLTLDNTSDSETEWFTADGTLHSAWTPPNSAILVRAGETGARHRVAPPRRGERTILKMVFASEGSECLPRFFTHLDSFPGLRTRTRQRMGRAPAKGGKSRDAAAAPGRRSKRR